MASRIRRGQIVGGCSDGCWPWHYTEFMPSIKQRVSLVRAYKGICPYCNQPIASLADLEVDHIIPESLKESELKPLLGRIGFPTLQINSYRNWLPVHGYNCNLRKS